MFIGSFWVEAETGSAVEDTDAEVVPKLELDPSTDDDCTTVAVGCEINAITELLGTEVKLDGVVVVATTAFGTGSLAVVASAPQAMYSKDWSGPLMSSTVEQNCDCLLIIN
jgi:hypothetical protein